MDTAVGKALHLGNAFRVHIETLTILLNNVPEMQKLQVATRQVKQISHEVLMIGLSLHCKSLVTGRWRLAVHEIFAWLRL